MMEIFGRYWGCAISDTVPAGHGENGVWVVRLKECMRPHMTSCETISHSDDSSGSTLRV